VRRTAGGESADKSAHSKEALDIKAFGW